MIQDGSMKVKDWVLRSFGSCAELVRDSVTPVDAKNLPYIGLEHIEEGNLRLSGYGYAEDVTSLKSRFRRGDILFGKLRPYFRKVVIAPFDGICSTDIWVVRPKPGIDAKFLYYWMASQQFVDDNTRASQGTKMPRAKWDFAERLERYIPLSLEQSTIGETLGGLDDKIKLNQKMIVTLEKIAHGIFKSWFLDFDPVKAKAEGRIPDAMNHETATLFTSDFEVVDGQKIPKGWTIGLLANSYSIKMGQSPPGSTYNEKKQGIVFFQGRVDFGFRYPSARIYCSRPTRFGESGDTLISVRAPVGDLNMAQEKCCIGRGVAAIRHVTGSRSFTYYQMMSLRKSFDIFEAGGTVFGSITKKDFNSIKCIVPPKEIIRAFEDLVFPLDQLIENLELQSRTLAKIRDCLIPKLLSGDIQLTNNESILETVA